MILIVKDANGKTRELHTSQALDAINYEVLDDYRTKYEPLKDEPVELVACPYFTTSVYDMSEQISCDYSELDSFVIFICIEGSCLMTDNEGNEVRLGAGETVLLPATTQELTIVPSRRECEVIGNIRVRTFFNVFILDARICNDVCPGVFLISFSEESANFTDHFHTQHDTVKNGHTGTERAH